MSTVECVRLSVCVLVATMATWTYYVAVKSIIWTNMNKLPLLQRVKKPKVFKVRPVIQLPVVVHTLLPGFYQWVRSFARQKTAPWTVSDCCETGTAKRIIHPMMSWANMYIHSGLSAWENETHVWPWLMVCVKSLDMQPATEEERQWVGQVERVDLQTNLLYSTSFESTKFRCSRSTAQTPFKWSCSDVLETFSCWFCPANALRNWYVNVTSISVQLVRTKEPQEGWKVQSDNLTRLMMGISCPAHEAVEWVKTKQKHGECVHKLLFVPMTRCSFFWCKGKKSIGWRSCFINPIIQGTAAKNCCICPHT